MNYEIIKAKRAMKKANGASRRLPVKATGQKWAVSEYNKNQNRKKTLTEHIDKDYSKYLEYAILTTVGLAVLSVSFPQLGYLSAILAILIIGAIIDTKLKHLHPDMKEKNTNEDTYQKGMRYLTPQQEQVLLKHELQRRQELVDALEINENCVDLATLDYKKSV